MREGKYSSSHRACQSAGPNNRQTAVLVMIISTLVCSHSHLVVICEVTLILTNSQTSLQSALLSVRLQSSRACQCEVFSPQATLTSTFLRSVPFSSQLTPWSGTTSSQAVGIENGLGEQQGKSASLLPPLLGSPSLPRVCPTTPGTSFFTQITPCCNYFLNETLSPLL